MGRVVPLLEGCGGPPAVTAPTAVVPVGGRYRNGRGGRSSLPQESEGGLHSPAHVVDRRPRTHPAKRAG